MCVRLEVCWRWLAAVLARGWLIGSLGGLASVASGDGHGETAAEPRAGSGALERVTLQLCWRYRYGDAGYFMAKSRGYYREAGFDVAFAERTNDMDAVREVVEGRADYGVSNSRLILSYLQGAPVVVLASIYQRSARVIVATERSGVRRLADLAGKRVMMANQTPGLEAQLMLAGAGVSCDQLTVLPHAQCVDALADGRADACVGYVTDEPFELSARGIPYVVFQPRDYGVYCCGDMLFTTHRLARSSPGRVLAFKQATLRGWEAALEDTDEAIRLVHAQYAPHLSLERLKYEAAETRRLIAPDLIEVGHVNLDLLARLIAPFSGADTRSEAGRLRAAEVVRLMTFDEADARPQPAWVRRAKAGSAAVLLTVAALGCLTANLRRVVGRRTAELAEAVSRLEEEVVERRQAEGDLRASERNFRCITEGAFDAIVIHAVGGPIVYANPQTAALTGYSAEELAGLSALDLVTPAARPREAERFRALAAHECDPVQYEALILRRGGARLGIRPPRRMAGAPGFADHL